MATDRDRAQEFSELLFETLFGLGLMPLRLAERPASFEKYPRQLLEKLRAADAGEPGGFERSYESWQSDVLRKARGELREEGASRLGELKRWVLDNEKFLRDRRVIRDLRTSIYGRAFMYLLVRLAPALEFKKSAARARLLEEKVSVQSGADGREREMLRAVADADYLRQHFAQHVSVSREKLREALGEDNVDEAVENSMEFVLANPRWFNRIFSGREDRRIEDGETEGGENNG
ncbi:MAG: hypothetical protein H0T74_01640 [Rubrobacteraceae bacterium]|nr:hypothetical protein [Rubrobacteraceae bacterium]MDQ3301793.1 hypothetical protein [Actinomycetota bacterium]